MGTRGERRRPWRSVLAALAATLVVGLTAVAGTTSAGAQAAGADDPAVEAFADTWVHRALILQEEFDRGEPLRNSLIPHSHNSANSSAYTPSLSTLDPNQSRTIGDQLRMGSRGIELDLHWVRNLGGLADGGFAVALCHGTTIELIDGVPLHVGCSVDRLFGEGLAEIRDFLAAPGNDDVVLLLYLENQLDGDATAHQRAVEALEEYLGEWLQPAPAGSGDGTCAPAPMDQSRQDVLDGGHQIVVVGNCGPGRWGEYVHDRGPLWDESSHDGAYPAYPDCVDTVRAEQDYEANFIRHWEDLTQLTALTNGGTMFPISPEVTRNMVACGVDMIGFDKLEPDDGRLEALIWSWAPDEPRDDPSTACAARGDDGRFRMADCGEMHQVTCRTAAGAWVVPEPAVVWADAEAACEAVDATFTVPPTGWQNERLGVVALAADAAVLWLPIGGPAAPSAPTDPAPSSPTSDGGDGTPAAAVDTGSERTEVLPRTGGGALALVAVVVLATGLAIRPRRAD